MKKKVIVLGTHDPTLGRRLADELAKFRLSDVSKSFYCFEKDDNGRKCKSACDICRDSKLKPN
jgi:wobble nucleotide-excising tRNase